MRKLETFVGQRVQLLVTILGQPAEVRSGASDQTYVWRRKVRYVAETYSTTGGAGFSVERQWRVSDCTVLFVVDQRGIVSAADYVGVRRACAQLAKFMITARDRQSAAQNPQPAEGGQ
jgi:hypothetical protein